MKVGTVTIGQSPRVDIVPEMVGTWGSQVEVLERGALDGLTRAEIESFAPAAGDYTLVTRLADGSSVTIAKRFVQPRVHAALRELDALGTDCLILLCTGDFPAVETRAPLVKPDLVLHRTVSALVEGKKVGLMTPSPLQVEQAANKWSHLPARLRVVAANPYTGFGDELSSAAGALREWGAEVMVMDCMGYTGSMKKLVQESLGIPVILARTLVARVVGELLS